MLFLVSILCESLCRARRVASRTPWIYPWGGFSFWQRGWRLRYCEDRLDAMRQALALIPRIVALLQSLPEQQQARNAALLEVGEIEQACERARDGTDPVPATLLPVSRELVGV